MKMFELIYKRNYSLWIFWKNICSFCIWKYFLMKKYNKQWFMSVKHTGYENFKINENKHMTTVTNKYCYLKNFKGK